MLEVKNLKKIYKTKKGVSVNALDGVSIQFPETGMVFLLGKSGSGKSTLLNVCGGLDAPSEGEVIVKGRSSKNFSGSDFDSYRNTFIGFIFQEYNILNEFTVEDNIALALELQGKSKDKAAIQALLEEVDLSGYAKRKPNTLSGGQKQRIAIARALIKAPEIIMADEPTGALDSNTGKQVFDTLKKLSKSKLVIVVSHDRDFAEQYGDRIIELQDGKVLSDVSKTQLEQQALSENINTVGDVLCIKNGAELSDTDFDKIKAFLKQSADDVIIATNEKDVKNFKKVSRISADGSKEVFCDTVSNNAPKRVYTKEESKFIRSKLPLRHASKIGLSSLKNKPFRLFMTVILCTVAFVLFSLMSTLNFYNSKATFIQTMADTNPPVMQLERAYKTLTKWYEKGEQNSEYEGYQYSRFAPSELAEISDTLNADAFGAFEYNSEFNLRQNDSNYWVSNINAFAVLPEGHSFREKINGHYPANNSEMAISTYTANALVYGKVYNSDGVSLELNSIDELIGKKVLLNGTVFTITGIFDSGEISAEFDILKDNSEANETLVYKHLSALSDGLHLIAFVNEDCAKSLADRNPDYKESILDYTSMVSSFKDNGQFVLPEWGNTYYLNLDSMPEDKLYIPISADKTTLKDAQVIMSSSLFANHVADAYNRLAEAQDENYEAADQYYQVANLAYEVRTGGKYVQDNDGKDNFVPYTDAEMQNKINALISAIKRDRVDITLGTKLYDNNNSTVLGELKTFEVAGVFVNVSEFSTDQVVFTQSTFDSLWDEQKSTIDYYSTVETNYKEPAGAIFNKLFVPFSYTNASAEKYWDIYVNDEWGTDDSRLTLTGAFVGTLQMVDETVKTLSQVFLYVGLVFAVFAILLLSNFISASITQKKREIGILRAVGARSADVFKIFFSESLTIAAICVALSAVASIVICGILNSLLAENIGASLFVFGLPSIAVLILTALITVIVATFLPVYNAARKKPVDSIRSL